MPFVGIGLHLLIAAFFAIHVVRTGREMYWLMILLSFPLLGSVVYFFAVYLPQSRLERGANQLARGALKVLDPERELRDAFRPGPDPRPTAQIRSARRVAAALRETPRITSAAPCTSLETPRGVGEWGTAVGGVLCGGC